MKMATWLVCGFLSLLLFSPVFAQEIEIVPERTHYLPNEPITLRFRGGPGNLLDWAGLYLENSVGGDFVRWQYLDGAQAAGVALSSGQATFKEGISKPGNYEARMYENDQYVLLASSPFVVTNSARLLLSKTVFLPGEAISITFTNGPGAAKDWIGLFPAGASHANPLARLYLDGTAAGTSAKTNGTLTLNAPAASGVYEARWFANDSTTLLDQIVFSAAYPAPVVSAIPGDRTVQLKWPAPSWAVALQKYVVLARPAAGADFTVVGEAAAAPGENRFTVTGLANGQEQCYVVRAEGRAGESAASAPLCAAPAALESGRVIAYAVPAGMKGNQDWGGALGMDFEVVNPVRVYRLGVFDDGSDGLKRTLTARLYDRGTRQPLTTLEFSPASPGVLIGGSRFKELAAPINLATGFKGAIVVEGYGFEERAANAGLGPLPVRTDGGNSAVLFVGRGRTGRAGTMPQQVDKGPANRYAAGTFEFSVTEVSAPGKVALSSIPDDGQVLLSWPAVTQPLPAVKYRILRAAGPGGNFTQIAEITATQYRDTSLPNGQEVCYRVRAVAESGTPGPESDTACQIPEVVAGGVAYLNPEGLQGNQEFGGSVGNDFDVVRPIRITRLGAFDDGSDGLKRTINVRLYNRSNGSELARLVFSPAEPGELLAGSRFKNLPSPVLLPIGFQGAIVASGYGEGERDGNEGIPGTADLNLELFTGGSLRFVGSSRWGDDPNGFPEIIDGGPANRYAAGTFQFEPAPLVSEVKLDIVRAGAHITISWTGSGTLEAASSVNGPWQAVPGAVSGLQILPSDLARFYRVRP